MTWLHNLLSKIENLLGKTSPKIEAVAQEIESLLPAALGIVNDINAIAPNKTLTELNAVATKYALPGITALAEGQTAGNVALNLGTQILAKNHAPTADTSLLNTVIQLAVTAANATAPAPTTSPAA
jgi:hypothetical protein